MYTGTLTAEGCIFVDTPQGKEAAVKAMDEIIGEDNMYLENTQHLFEPNASSCIVSDSGKIQTEKGVTFTNVSGSWEYKIRDIDRRIKLYNDKEIIEVEVVDKPREETFRPIGYIDENFPFGSDGDMTIRHMHFETISDKLTVILSNDYSSCIGTPYHRYYVNVRSRARHFPNAQPNEIVALETLREMISEFEFRKYLKYGFLSVNGSDGKIYQIFRHNLSHIKVWDKGNLVKEICVRIQDNNIPLTDNVIALKIIAETDTTELEKMGNVYKMEAA